MMLVRGIDHETDIETMNLGRWAYQLLPFVQIVRLAPSHPLIACSRIDSI